MIHAICFRCGAQKSEPLNMCGDCHVIPEIERHQLRSICLSSDCLKQENLEICARYLKKKKRLPKIHDKVIRRAQQKLRTLEAVHSNSQSMEFSSAFFDFSDLESTKKRPDKIVRVHVIGRSKDEEDAPSDNHPNLGTYHQIWWQVGKDITSEEFSVHRDPTDEIYVIYRWLEERWTHWCVSREDFERFKMAEDAQRSHH